MEPSIDVFDSNMKVGQYDNLDLGPVEYSSDYFRKQPKIVESTDMGVIYNPGRINENKAIEHITFDIRAEEYIVIFGPSGCGKSTTLNTIAGLEIPTAGELLVDAKNLAMLSPNDLAEYHRKTVGMVFQSYNLIPTLTVLQNVVLPLVFEKVGFKERRILGMEILERLGLSNLEKRYPPELSGGQQQRVGIARALIGDPPIILADEPVGNLDSVAAKNVMDILNALNMESKKTIIAVTHNPEHLYYADRVFYMKDGHIVMIQANKNKRIEKKKQIEITRKRNELDLLLQAYPDLSSMQLHIMLAPFKAKMLVAFFMSQFETKDIQDMEKLVENRLLGRITEKELYETLTRPANDQGLGFPSATAKKFVSIVDDVVAQSDLLKKYGKELDNGEIDPVRQVVSTIRYSLLDVYKGDLTMEQVEALNKGIEFRISHKINRDEFQEFLDRPFSEGGVGLNRKTAKKFSRKMELIMLVQFGQAKVG